MTEGDAMDIEETGGKKPSVDSIWVEKYRPQSLDEVIAHEHIMSTISSLIEQRKLPHMLFYGPPGTGKTSTILAVARKLYGKRFRSLILELNASDDRGIGVVREQIKSFAGTQKIFSTGVKLVILDEADAMTKDAQAALRRVIEKYTKSTRFCLICNYAQKIIPAVQSRCTKFRFAPLSDQQILPRIKHIIKEESVEVTDDGMEAVLRLGRGDMRKCLNVLQATQMAYGKVDEENAYKCTGNPTPKTMQSIVEILLNEDFHRAFTSVQDIKVDAGIAIQDIISEVYYYVQTIDLPARSRIALYRQLADIEYRSSCGSSEKLQVAALVGAFQICRQEITMEVDKQ